MSFQPNPNDELTIGGQVYRVAEHPAAPGIAHGQEGRAGIVYRLVALTPPPAPSPLPPGGRGEGGAAGGGGGRGEGSAALKVFKPRFRLPFLVSQAEKLAAYADLPGLTAARRTVLTPSRHADLLRQHPDLTYAVLMPWIEGPNWQEFLLDERPLTVEQSLLLARALARVLLGMEERGLAHCDLSGPNVMLPALANPPSPFGKGAGGEGVELIDLEGFYAPGMLQPQALSSGSAGYAHRQAAGGLWGPEADRFAGAVLLAEMLGWCDPAVVKAAWGESYFEPGEMQRDCPRAQLLEESLRRTWGDGVAGLFRRAWRSDTLADCPTFGEWLVALPGEMGRKSEPIPEPGKEARGPKEAQEEIVKEQKPPSEQTLEQLRTQAYALSGEGRWHEALNLCNTILGRWPDQEDIVLLRIRIGHLAELEQEVIEAWTKATQTGQGEDWEACFKAAKAILQQAPRMARYEEIARQAEQEILWVATLARAETLLAQKQLEQAELLLSTVPITHPRAARLKAQIDLEWSKAQRIADLLQQAQTEISGGNFDKAATMCQIALGLGANPSIVQPVLDRVEDERRREQEFQGYLAEVNRAAASRNWETAIQFLDRAMALRPHRTDLHSQKEQLVRFQEWTGRIREAETRAKAYDWSGALHLLDGIPDKFMDAGLLRRHLRREVERQEQLVAARRAYDGERVLALLADTPSDYPERDALTRWAQVEIERRRQLAEARQAYDGERMLELLSAAPPDYPERETLTRWAQEEIERRAQLSEVQRTYDGRRFLALVHQLPPHYPGREELCRRAEQEAQRQEAIENAWQKEAWEQVLALLQETPEDYPDRDRRIQEAEKNLERQRHWEHLQRQVIAAMERRDWNEAIALCQQALAEGGREIVFGALKAEAETEQQMDRRVEQKDQEAAAAEQLGNWERAVALLSEALSLRPARDDLRKRLEEANRKWHWERIRLQARDKIALGDWEAALNLLEGAPPGDTELTAWKEQARNQLIRSLYAQAEQAERAGDWTTAWSILGRLSALRVADEMLPQRVERVRREWEYAQALEEARQAMARSRWGEAGNKVQIALGFFPQRMEAQALLEEIIRRKQEARTRRLGLVAAGAGVAVILLILLIILLFGGRLAGSSPLGP